MTDQMKSPETEAPVAPETTAIAGAAGAGGGNAEPPADRAANMDPNEIEKGKLFAILSYVINFVGLPFFLIPLITRDNEFALYHAKQNTIIWIIGVVGGTISGILATVCIGFVLGPAILIFLLVLNIMGLLNAINGRALPLPLVGQWAERMMEGLKKV